MVWSAANFFLLIIVIFLLLYLWYKQPFSKLNQLAKRIMNSDDYSKVITESIIEGVITANEDGTILNYNRSIEKMFGYTAVSLITKNVLALIPEKHKEKHLAGMKRLSETGEIAILGHTINTEGLRKDGSIFPIALSLTRISTGNTYIYTAVIRDMSEHKRQTEKLRLTEEKYSVLVSSIKDYAIFMLDANGYIISWNSGAEKIKGWNREEIIGQHFSIFYPQEMIDQHWPQEELKRAVAEGRFENEGWRIRKDGSKFWADSIITPLYNKDDILIGYSKITRDLTERKAQEEKIKDLNSALEIRLAASEAFNQSLSHDLNAPLRGIEGFSEALEQDGIEKLDDKCKDYVKRIRRAAERMRQLVKDMMKLARVTKVISDLNITEVSLSNLFKSISSEYQMGDPARRIAVNIQDDMIVNADPSFISLLAHNLFSNAWKFTSKNPAARIDIGSTVVNGDAVYYVKDNGIGFDQTKANLLFQPFKRLHTQDEFEGSGIGLTIAKRVVELHKGKIWGEGVVNNGATFYFTLGT